MNSTDAVRLVCFDLGGVLVRLASGWEDACRRANVAGAITVTRRGPATAPTAAEIDAFLAGLSAPAS